MKRLIKKSLYKIFVSLFVLFYSFVPQSIAIGQVIDEYSQGSAAPIIEDEIPEESLLEEEVVLPEEEIPPVVEQPLVEETPVIEESIIEEPVVEEPVIEEPTIEPVEVIKEVMSYPVWVINGDTATTYDVAQLGKTYIAPQNSRVRIIFTKLPENLSTISIEEITLTQEEIEATGAVSDKAYDIKTDMIDGTFEYDLVLPSIEEDTKVVYVEEREDIFTDVKKVANEVINEKDDTVKVKDLNHFTIFIVSATVKISGQVNGSSQVTVTPGQTITVTMEVELSESEPNDWHSTQYKIGNNDNDRVCLNNIPNPDRDNDGSHTVSFDIVAPNTIGTYNLRLRAYDSSNCNSNYNERSLLSAIVVANLPPVANPSLSRACGLDIALVIDNSTSIDSGELAQMKTAMTSFTSALNGTPTQFSVVKFGTSATLLQSFTGDISVVNSAINGISLTSSTNYTNWEDGLLKASDSFGGRVDKPNLVIFATDGDPTTSNTVGGININQPNAHLTPAVNQANIIKNNNTRILMLGIGMGSGSLSRLESISGPNDNTGKVLTSDVITTDFSGLAAQLATFATQTCGGTITVRKIINGNANAPLDNWQFTVNGQSYNTDAQGYTVAIPVTSGTYSVMENPVKSGYSFNSATCVKNGNPVGSSVPNGVDSITVGNSDIVSCTFINNYLSICGDTIVSSGEECDDGNSVNTDTCLNSCKAPSCGDGYLYIGNEQCDNGASNTDIACIASYNDTCNYCDNNCVPHTVTGPYCGNGIIDGSETCDGSNLGNYSSNDFQCNQCSIKLIEPKVTICHSSSSHSNPYITNRPNKNGTVGGHVSHEGPVWYPGITVQWGDIIPPFAYIGGFFPGLNWSTEGQAIYNNGCNLPQGTLIVKKIITNDNGGNKSYSDFSFNIGVTSYTFEDDGQNDISLIPGKYTVTENTANGYTPTYNNCSNVIVPISGSAICTITNDDIAPKLTLNKIVDNNNGGTLVESAWTLTANGGTSGILEGPGATGNTDVVSGSTFKVGTYTLYESIQNSNYTSSSWSCVKNGGSPVEGSSITLGLEDIATCTITNSDNKPTLTLNKVVVNDNGGTASESAWTLTATSDGIVPEILTGFGASGSTDVVSPDTFKIGTYTLSESGGPSGYSASQWSCLKNKETMPVLGNTITLTFGDTATCTIINDDIAPTLKLTKVVVGGTSVAEDWTLSAGGTDGFSDLGNSNTFHQVKADVIYSLSESGPEGYSSSWWKCSGGEASGNTVKLSLGENVTCTITNTRDTGFVKVNKYTDINGDGDWSDSNERSNSNANTLGFRWSLDSGVGNNMGIIVSNVVTGPHTVDEIMPVGYHFESWYVNGTGKSCSNPNGGTLPITLDITKDNTKEITLCNARDTGTITIIKDAINNSEENFYFDTNFGDFELEDDGNKYNGGTPEKRSFTIPTGSYWIDERNESGWKLTNLECIGDDNSIINLPDGRVDIDLDYGENVTCTYTNTELAKVWGFKYNDENGDSDWDFGEWGLGNWRIFIDEGNGIYDGTEPSDLTSNHLLSLGYYEFDNLLPGIYTICEQSQAGWTNTTPLCRTITLTPGDVDGSVNFANIRYGSILVHKFEDTNGDGDIDVNENGLEGWQMNVYKGYGCNGVAIPIVTDVSGNAQFNNIVAGHYSVMEVIETNQEGWVTTTPVCQNIHVNPGQTTSVNIGNVILTDIHGVKWSDFNGNGMRDCMTEEKSQDSNECESLLSGWTINLFKWNDEGYYGEPFRTMVTDDSEGEFGWYWFEDLLPGKYKICEVQQNGWTQTYPINEIGNCHEIILPINSSNNASRMSLNYVEGYEYNFGNTINPKLEIQKLNDTAGADMVGGDTVVYTMIVTAPEITEDGGIYTIKDVKVMDIMPSGFTYQAGSWTAVSYTRGDLKALLITSDPAYVDGIPGVWELGDMMEGEIITLRYTTKISLLQDPGLYKDIAWTDGESVLGARIYGNSDSGIFVGTEVKVIEPIEIEEGQVLGASITLPRTGAETYITLGALISMILGFILLVFNPKKRIKNLFIAGVVLFSMFFILKPLPTYASVADIDVRIEQPATPTNKNTFKIGFVALDLQNRTVTVECYKDDILFGTYATNSGSCEVTPALVTTSGTYDFYVKAKAGGDENISSTVSVEVVLEKPLPVVNYLKTEGTCKYTLKFKTANDGRTSKVEIFRSSTQPFTANASTLIDTISVAPNADVSYTDNDSLDCNKEYYYAIRSVDDYNNVSSLVTDDIVTIVRTPAPITPTEITGEEEGEVAGEETTPEEEKEDESGEVKGDEDVESEDEKEEEKEEDSDTLESFWSDYKYFIIAVLVVALGSGAYKYVRRKK